MSVPLRDSFVGKVAVSHVLAVVCCGFRGTSRRLSIFASGTSCGSGATIIVFSVFPDARERRLTRAGMVVRILIVIFAPRDAFCLLQIAAAMILSMLEQRLLYTKAFL